MKETREEFGKEKDLAKFIDELKDPSEINALSVQELKALAEELRRRIIRLVSVTGGHLASSLGTVELTVSLMKVFDFAEDKDRIVFDVGHQSYAYKMLTGRMQKFSGLRQKDGISGFPKREESPYDFFNTGHSSTSLSAVLGMERAFRIKNRSGENTDSEELKNRMQKRFVAVIGDGAMTGGMFFEALNDIDISKDKPIIIINDNQMSISPNTGGLATQLRQLRISQGYIRAKERGKRLLPGIPLLGNKIYSRVSKMKNRLRRKLVGKAKYSYFEILGLRYYGPVDGHDIGELVKYLKVIKNLKHPSVLHVVTVKGKGYEPAEESPTLYHGVSPFPKDVGVTESAPDENKLTFTDIFSQIITEEAGKNKNIAAITAAMAEGTGLSRFRELYPDRFFDVGICEQHAVTLAAGMACGGLRPVVAVYSTFLQRALDQTLHDVVLQKLPVIFAVDRSGLVGRDGETHQGIYDSSFLSALPGTVILCPCCYEAMRDCFRYAFRSENCIFIRYPRGGEDSSAADAYAAAPKTPFDESEMPGAVILKQGSDVSIVSLGSSTGMAIEASYALEAEGVSCELIDAGRLKPLPYKTVIDSASKTGHVYFVEEEASSGGLAASFLLRLSETGDLIRYGIKAGSAGIPDFPVNHGSRNEQLEELGLDPSSLSLKIHSFLREKS